MYKNSSTDQSERGRCRSSQYRQGLLETLYARLPSRFRLTFLGRAARFDLRPRIGYLLTLLHKQGQFLLCLFQVVRQRRDISRQMILLDIGGGGLGLTGK